MYEMLFGYRRSVGLSNFVAWKPIEVPPQASFELLMRDKVNWKFAFISFGSRKLDTGLS